MFGRTVAAFLGVVLMLATAPPSRAQQCAASPAGIVSWWRAEGDATDRMGLNHGTAQNGATFAPGKVGQAFSLDGVDDIVSIPGSASLAVTGSFSLAAWVRPESFSAGTHLVAGTAGGYQLYTDAAGAVVFGFYDGGSWHLATTASTLPLGIWSHLAGTFDAATGALEVFVGGVSAVSGSAGAAMPTATGNPLGIGGFPGLGSFFHGLIDEPALFGRALSAVEIAAIHDVGSAGLCACAEPSPGPVSWWRAEDDARDAVGTRHGSLENGATFSAGRVGQAFALDGADDRVAIPSFPMGEDWTIAGWIRPDTAGDGYHSPFFNRSSGHYIGLAMNYNQPAYVERAGKFNLVIGDGNSWQVSIDSSDQYQEGQWHHVSATKSGDTYSIYVDGTPQGTQTVAGVSGLYRSEPAVLGHWYYGSGQSYTGGAIDEVVVFDRALSAAEVADQAGAGDAGLCARSCADVSPGPLSWWRADAGDGSDDAGSNHGTLVNGATTAPGRVGAAFAFDGVDDYVLVPDSASLDLTAGEFSISLWMNLRTVKTQNFLVGHDEGGGTANKWIFMYSDGAFRFHLNGPAIGNQYPVVVPYPVSAGIWYFVTLTRTGTLYTVSVNGEPVDTATSAIAIPSVVAPLTIGQAEGLAFIDGAIDEPMIFTRALSAVEVTALYEAGWRGACGPVCAPPPAGLVSWWRGEDATDATGTNNGMLVNGATTAPGRVGGAFSFDGDGDYLDAGTGDAFGFDGGTADFSIGAWIRPTEIPTSSPYDGYMIVQKGTFNPLSGWGFYIGLNGTLGFTGLGAWGFGSAQGTIAPGAWAHVAVTKSGSLYRLYKDGAEVASLSHGNLETSAAPLKIGSDWYGVNGQGNLGDNRFRGLIDEPKVFSRALSDAEIAALHAARAAGMCAERTDVALTKTRSAASVAIGGSLTYTLTAANDGPGVAAGVRVVDALPAEMAYVSATPAAGSCAQSGGTVTCELGNLAPGASASVTVDVTAVSGALGVENTAVASSQNFETDAANNTAAATVDVLDPQGTLEPASIDFGLLDPGAVSTEQTVTLTSTGLGDLLVDSVELVGTHAGEYLISGGTCGSSQFPLPQGTDCTILVQFAPTSEGTKNDARLEVVTDDRETPTLTVNLAGRGRGTLTVCPSGCDHATVQAAVAVAGQGDVIEIGAGVYRESVRVGSGQDLTLRGAGSPLGASPSVIDADIDRDGLAKSPALTVEGDWAGTRVAVENLVLRRGDPGLFVDVQTDETAIVTVDRSQLTLNTGRGGALVSSAGTATLTLTNVLVRGNEGGGGTAGGVTAAALGSGVAALSLMNCTVTENATGTDGGGLLVTGQQGAAAGAQVTNSVFWKNRALGAGQEIRIDPMAGPVSLSHTDVVASRISGTYSDEGGNIGKDPIFVNAPRGDCHLNVDSPCRNVGTASGAPAVDIEADARPQGTGIDLGADERVAKSYAAVTLLGPKGGEQLLGGQGVNVVWDAPSSAKAFDLAWSRNNGATWTAIKAGVAGKHWPWTPPQVTANTAFKLKLVGRKVAGGTVVGTAISSAITVGALRIVRPNGKERIAGGADYPVKWQTSPGKTVTGGKAYFSKNGGVSWALKGTFTGNPGELTVKLPVHAVDLTACRMKVELYNGATLVGTDTSNANFTVLFLVP